MDNIKENLEKKKAGEGESAAPLSMAPILNLPFKIFPIIFFNPFYLSILIHDLNVIIMTYIYI
jgi:hypothetical protein